MARNERSAGFIVYHTDHGSDASTAEAAGRRVADARRVEYLLLDYGRHWDFPKGHVDAGEDELAAAVRELHEETGLTRPQVVSGFRHEIVYFFRDRKKGLVRKTVVFFLAEVSVRDVVLSHEHVGFEFLPYEQARKRVTYASAKAVRRAAPACLTGSASPPPSLFDTEARPTQ